MMILAAVLAAACNAEIATPETEAPEAAPAWTSSGLYPIVSGKGTPFHYESHAEYSRAELGASASSSDWPLAGVAVETGLGTYVFEPDTERGMLYIRRTSDGAISAYTCASRNFSIVNP